MTALPQPTSDAPVLILWQVPWSCNMTPACSYCIIGQAWAARKHQWPGLTVDEWLRTFRFLRERLGPLHTVAVCGEPMSDSMVIEVLAELSLSGTVGVVSNIVAPLEQWAQFPIFSRGNIAIVGSYHWEHWSVEEFVAKRAALGGMGFALAGVPVVAVPWEWEETFERLSALRAAGCPTCLLPYTGKWDGRDWPQAFSSEQQQRLMGENGVSEAAASVVPDSHGHLCWTGVKALGMAWNGTIYRCYRIGEVPPIGDAREPEQLQLPEGPTPCEAGTCACADWWKFIVKE